MKKRLIITGISLAVLGTGMIVKKLRNKKNNEVKEIKEENIVTEEVAIDEEEPIIADVEDMEIVKEMNENNYVPHNKAKEIMLNTIKNICKKLCEIDKKLNDVNEEEYDIKIDRRMLVIKSYKKECAKKIRNLKRQLILRQKLIVTVRRCIIFTAKLYNKLNK